LNLIDRTAYATPLRKLDPAYKAGFSLFVLVLCLTLNRPLVGAVAAAWMWILSIWWAQLPASLIRKVLLAEGAFLALSVAGVAVNIRFHPFFLGMTADGLDSALLLFTRALGCASAMNFLALTTPLVDLLDLGRRLRLAPLLLDLMTLIYRFIFTLLESLERMRTAQDARLGYSGFWRGMSSAGSLAARLFVDAYQRSARVQIALEGRGYAGELRVLPGDYRRDGRVFLLAAIIALSMFFVWSL
jgi:cobalt/nickel transport system permease protein